MKNATDCTVDCTVCSRANRVGIVKSGMSIYRCIRDKEKPRKRCSMSLGNSINLKMRTYIIKLFKLSRFSIDCAILDKARG